MAEQRQQIFHKIDHKKSTEDDIDDKMAGSFFATVNNPPPVFDSGNNCTDDDIDQKMAVSCVAKDNDQPPLFYSDPKNEQLPLDQKQVAEKCGDNNRPNLAKDCKYSSCFSVTKKKCHHEILNVQINNLGEFVLFPSMWYHQGYFKIMVT